MGLEVRVDALADACSSGGAQEPAVGNFPRAVGSERAECLFQRELMSSLQSVLREHHSDLTSLHSNVHALKECAEGTDLPAPLEVNVTLTNRGGVRLAQDMATQTEHDLRQGARVVLTDGPLAGRSGTVALEARSGGRVFACSVRVDGSTPGSPEWQLDAWISEVEPLAEEPTVSSPAAPPRREASPLDKPSLEPPQLNSREGTGTVGKPVTFCAKAARWKDDRGRFCKSPADVVPPEALYPKEAPLTDASFAPGAIVLLRPAKVKKEKLAGVVEVVVVRSTSDFAFVSSPLLAGSQDRPRQFAKSSLIRTNRMQCDAK